MSHEDFLEDLRRAAPGADLLDSPEDLLAYSFDGTPALRQKPLAVILPAETAHIPDILRAAVKHDVPVVTRGSGTGLSGGSVPAPGSLVLGTARLNRILELDAKNLTLRAEPGVTTLQIAEAAEAAGLFYPPDPGSMKISTIGGNVAENSGGLRGLKYGVTRDYVMGLKVALADGSVLETGNKCVKDVAGFSIKDLFVGSEGTLGVILEILLRLLPKPAAKRTMLASFPSMAAAAATVSEIIEQRIIPCTLEFLDKTTLRCVEDYAKVGLPLEAESILLMETDGHPAVVEAEAERMAELARKNGAIRLDLAKDDAEAARLSSARRSAFVALARLAPTTILEDVTVPRSRLVEMVEFIQDVARRRELKVGTFGHMGDGNLHPTFLANEKNPEEMKRVEEAFDEIFRKAIELGGTITGEHGVGLAKKAYLPLAIAPPALEFMRKIKRALDPEGVLNPGKIFDVS
ncbi:MAG: FAD-binding protein [Verrucomicrobiae bacterium]|nr:FAD-binding protein [Verrucomicrobiae bacterium]